MHPHRGIETVTYTLEGSVHHRDSIGNSGLIGADDVQWMTAGGGIMHEEMPRRGPSGNIYGFQLWVNLPSHLKWSPVNTMARTRSRHRNIRRANFFEVSIAPGKTFTQKIPRGHTAVA